MYRYLNLALSLTFVVPLVATAQPRPGQEQGHHGHGQFQQEPPAGARGANPNEGSPPLNTPAANPIVQEHHQQPAVNQERIQQEQQARQAQEQQIKAQQEQARVVHEQQLRAHEEQRRIQEQAVRTQEEQARSAQIQAMKAQQEQARRTQEQMQRAQQERVPHVEQQRALEQQHQPLEQHQPDARQAAEQLQREQAARKSQEQQALLLQQREQQSAQERMHHVTPPQSVPGTASGDLHRQREDLNANAHFHGTNPINGQSGFVRSMSPHPLTMPVVPIQKAIPMPILEGHVSAQEHEHAQVVNHNLEKHLIAVERSQAPTNIIVTRNTVVNNYINNYQTVINNHPIYINRQNTFINHVHAHEYPHWYQQDPGWTYSNGFTLGNAVTVGPDWLRWGWHPYFGPPPEGFVCAVDYIPTPWIYVPAYGLWRQPGLPGYAESGPPYDYDGPISVEVLEPRHIHVRDPYSGWNNDRTINVVYLYNAFYYPEFERYGYMNRHGYFIWLNLDDSTY